MTEHVLEKLTSSQNWEWKSVWVSASVIQTVRYIVIKEVNLPVLGCKIELTLNEAGIVAKKSPVPIEKLLEYIKFTKINQTFPPNTKNQ